MNKPNNFQTQSFVEIEHEILDYWKKNATFANIQKQHSNDAPYWYYDGPPFATGLPHHGHLLASTIKDIIPRYFEMLGHKVPRHFGWDCHGVPIEHAIDKDLGLSTEEAIEKLGLAGYNQACRGIVDKYASQWEETIHRMGRWVDFNNTYKTLDKDFMESVWWAVSELHKKGLIYQGVKVVPYSTQLRTPLSNFEASSNYQSVQNPAITVLTKLVGEDCYLAIWTTTPWTLPTNLAICIGPHQYIKVKDPKTNKKIILAQACLKHFPRHDELEVIEEIPAASLVGKQYHPFFPYYKNRKNEGAFRILKDDYVTTTDGTGLVHCAPAHGEDDYRVCQEAGIPTICALNDAGCFLEEVTDFSGLFVKDADKKIIQHLKQQEQIYHQDVIVHNYPFCPRTDTPLIYKTIPSWYVKVTAIKDKLIKANKSIHWVPEHIKEGRFGKWLENAKDWAISRNRYWGTPIPIWINDQTQNIKCIGSIHELHELSQVKPSDLHREHIDSISFTIPGEEGTYHRIPEVLDCWFESGSMPFAQLHYPFENQKAFHDLFPATFIAEGIDQTRGWFYTLTVLSCALFDKPAFKNVIVNGIVMAEDGKKMSKRLKNYTPPNELLEKVGADALRLYLIQSNLVRAEEQRFSDEGVIDIARRVLLPWKNAFVFLTTYAEIDNWSPSNNTKKTYNNLLDRWILGRLDQLLKHLHHNMREYKLHSITQHIESFLDDLTNTYIRLNRARFWSDGVSEDKNQAFSCLDEVLKQFTIMMAPFTPFLSEKIFQLRNQNILHAQSVSTSVHGENYPKTTNHNDFCNSLDLGVHNMQQILILGRQARNNAKIKTKIPLKSITIAHGKKTVLDSIKPVESYIHKELNVKKVIFTTDENAFILLKAKLNLPKLGKKLGKKIREARAEIENLSHTQIQKYEETNHYESNIGVFTGDDIIIERKTREGSQALSNRHITIELNTDLDEALIGEGIAREMVNRIQKLRKEKDLQVSDRIEIKLHCDENLEKIIEKHRKYIETETLCLKIEFSANKQSHSIEIEEYVASITIGTVQKKD